MSSDPPNDLLLKIATAVAITIVIVGGSLYMGAVMAPERPSNSTTVVGRGTIQPVHPTSTLVRPDLRDMNPPANSKGVAPDPSEPPPASGLDFGSIPALTLPGVMDLATRPVVKPTSQLDSARGLLETQLPAIEACWRDQVADPQTSMKVFVHFQVAGGKTGNVSVQVDGVNEPLINFCVRALIEGLDASAVDDRTSVYWPIKLDKKLGAQL